jgi:hypothetical protein
MLLIKNNYYNVKYAGKANQKKAAEPAETFDN